MFGDAMITDDHVEKYGWGCVDVRRLESIYFWFWFRKTLPVTWPLLFVGTFLIPLFFFNHSDGYIFMGSILSSVFCVLALLSYWQIRPWRRHPSILIIMICFISIGISAILVYNAAPHGGNQEIDKSDVDVIEDSSYSASDRTASCLLMSFFIQLTLLAREGWILTLSLDLLTSITNPFASYKANLKQYHVYIWTFTTLSAIVLVSTRSCQGEFLSNGTCWLRISGADSACFWGFFMAWVIMFYVNAAAVLAYAFSRVSKGLESTYATRYACVADTFRVVFLYFIYGMIIAIFFLVIYYSYQSGISRDKLYFLEHCFAYLIACRGFIDALIWFFSHGFVSESGVVTNLSVVTTDALAQRRRSRRSTPSATAANRHPFAADEPSAGGGGLPRDDGDDIADAESDDAEDDAAADVQRGLLTLADVFMPDRSLRGLFAGWLLGRDEAAGGSRLQSHDNDDASVGAVRSPARRRAGPVGASRSGGRGDTAASLQQALLADDVESSRQRSRSLRPETAASAAGPDAASVTTRASHDTHDVDVSPQLNVTLRREVLALVTRGIQESVTRMIERDRKLRDQLAAIGVVVYDERDYFQDAAEDDSDDVDSDDVDSGGSSGLSDDADDSDGYRSASSVDGYDTAASRASDASASSIHSLLSSQHSARSTGLLPAPAATLPSSLVAARRVQPIQRSRAKAERKSDRERRSDKADRPSNASGSQSKSKRSRHSDSRGRSRRSRGHDATDAAPTAVDSDLAQSPLADLAAAHRAGVAPAASLGAAPSAQGSASLLSAALAAPQPLTSTARSTTPDRAQTGSRAATATSPAARAAARAPHSHHVPSHVHLTSVNHSYHFRADDVAQRSQSASLVTPQSASQSASLLASSPLHHPTDEALSGRAQLQRVSRRKPASTNTPTPAPPSHSHSHSHSHHAPFESTVIQSLMSIVGGQYYPGEYGVDHLVAAPAASVSAAGGAHSVAFRSQRLPQPVGVAHGHSYSHSHSHSAQLSVGRAVGTTWAARPDDVESGRGDLRPDDAGVDADEGRAQSQDSQASGATRGSSSLRQRKQAILDEFRPPAVVVFYFDEQRHRFRDFRPATFRQLRALAGISEEAYLRFIQQPAQERLSEGRSGAFFFICGAGELVVKTIARSEAATLLKILDDYRAHFVRHPDSLIVRFLGLHSITLYGTEFHFVVMKNIFPPGQRLQERYDLKGSYIARHAKAANRPGSIATCRHCGALFVVGDAQGDDPLGRRGGADRRSSLAGGAASFSSSSAAAAAARRRRQQQRSGVLEAGSACPEMAGGHEPSVTLKDNDFASKIRLHPEHALQVIETIFNDSDALAAMGLMDYSLLVGVQHVHYDLLQHPDAAAAAAAADSAASAAARDYRSYPARVVIAPNQYYFGIIDILQTWDWAKQLEHFAKVQLLGQPYDGISAIPPHDFKRRFQRKVASVIDHASLIREVTGSWQGKREVGSVYSLTALPPDLLTAPPASRPSVAPFDGEANGDDSHSDGGDDDDVRRSVGSRPRESLTSRHSLVVSADQGAAASDYTPDAEAVELSVSPLTTLRSLIAGRNSVRAD